MAIVLDAMGGDLAPQAIVAGAVQATRSSTLPIILVGQHDVLEAELRKHDTTDLPLTIRHAPDVITMHDHATAVRQRPQSSIRVACDLVKGGEGKALVSAGHSGATMAAALMAFGRIAGISRPALIALIPARTDAPDAPHRHGSQCRLQAASTPTVRSHGQHLFRAGLRRAKSPRRLAFNWRRANQRAMNSLWQPTRC